MFKAIILLTRRADMSHQAFADWWLKQHAPLARQLPGLRKLTFNLVSSDAGIDGVSELWFDTQAACAAAYASEMGKRVAADSMGSCMNSSGDIARRVVPSHHRQRGAFVLQALLPRGIIVFYSRRRSRWLNST